MEADLWQVMQRELRPYGDLTRIENLVGSGIPDVDGTIEGHSFKVELKFLAHWPLPGNVVKVPGFRQEQRIWIRRRCELGKARDVFVLMQIAHTYLLFDGLTAVRQLGLVRADVLKRVALVCALDTFPTRELLRHLAPTCVPKRKTLG